MFIGPIGLLRNEPGVDAHHLALHGSRYGIGEGFPISAEGVSTDDDERIPAIGDGFELHNVPIRLSLANHLSGRAAGKAEKAEDGK
jgi:hypothetical protein